MTLGGEKRNVTEGQMEPILEEGLITHVHTLEQLCELELLVVKLYPTLHLLPFKVHTDTHNFLQSCMCVQLPIS